MKKTIFYLSIFVLLAAGCNSGQTPTQPASNQSNPANNQTNPQVAAPMANTSTPPSYKDFATSKGTSSFDSSNNFYSQYSVNGKPVSAIPASSQGDGYATLNLPATNITVKAPLGWLAFTDGFQTDHIMSPDQSGEIEFSVASLKAMGNASSIAGAKPYILSQYQSMQQQGGTVKSFNNSDGSFSVLVFGGKINGMPQTISQNFFQAPNNPDGVLVMTANYPPSQSDSYLDLLGLIIDSIQFH